MFLIIEVVLHQFKFAHKNSGRISFVFDHFSLIKAILGQPCIL